ncbi:hypothetical protein ABEW05_010961 [Botrytis cinerea]
MGFYRVFTLLNPGDPRSRPPRPRREESGREQSQRAPPFNPPCYEAPPPSYDSISTAFMRSEGVRSNYDNHSATARTNSGGLVAPSGPSSRPCSSHSPRRERPHSSYTSEVDRRFSQASFDKSRRSSRSEPDLSHELINDRRRSTTEISADLKVILDDKLAMSPQMRITKNRLRTITTQVKLHMSPEALSSLGPLLVLQHMMNGALAPDKHLGLCL